MAITRSQKVFHSLRQNKRALIGSLIVLFVILMAIAAPLISPKDPLTQDLKLRLKPPGWHEANRIYWLGTDHLGRDIASRIIYGSRISLIISFFAVLIRVFLG